MKNILKTKFKQYWEKHRITLTISSVIVVIMICISALTSIVWYVCDTIDEQLEKIKLAEMYEKMALNHTRDVYVARLESKFDAAREELAIEIDNYIDSVAPNSDISSLNLIDLCTKYNVDIRLPLVQGHIESHFGTKGTASKTNSIFNVGAFDGHDAKTQIRNGYGYKHPDFSVEPYLKLLTTRYLVNGKTEEDLLEKFVDRSGARYASSTNYEQLLRTQWDVISKNTKITEKYEVYKKYKLKLGR
jgi:hypothetical protein